MSVDHDVASSVASPAAPIPTAEPPITRTEVDGVPVFSVHADGPLRAALLFRVGKVDETLATSGITHLVEHLALTTVGQQPYQYNAFVEGLITAFGMSGSPAEIVDFFKRVTAGLGNLPLDRIEHESRVLETEHASRRVGPVDSLLSVRFGPTGWGLAAYPEYGLKSERSRVDSWRAAFFSRENAAFIISGQVPEDLQLELGNGQPRAVPELERPSFPLPAWMAIASPGVGMSILADRSTQLTAVLHIAERRAQARLRYQDGVSYNVAVSYLRLNASTAHITLWADALPDNAAQVRDGLLAVVEELIAKGPTHDEMLMELDMARKALDDPGRLMSRLQGAAAKELYGATSPERREILGELEQSSPAELTRALDQAMPSALMIVPEGLTVSGRFQPVPQWSDERLSGRALRLRGYAGAQPTRLILAPTGITFVIDQKRIVTIRYDQCAGLLTWTDGSRTMMGNDGSRVHLRPADWRKGVKAIEEIDSHIPKERYVALGDRPRPDPAALVAPVGRSTTIWRWILWAIAFMFWVFLLASLARLVTGTAGPDDPAAAVVYACFAGVLTLLLLRPFWLEALRASWRARRAH